MSKKSISRKDQICWLAGIFDGEGCISAYQDHNSVNGARILDVKAKIVNTCMFMVQRISEILVDNHIGFYYATNGNQNPALEIAISGYGRVEKFLKLLLPYLTTKAPQAELVLELITYRKSLGFRSPSNGTSLLDDEKINSIIQRLKELKHTKVSPLVCSRQANKILGIPIDYTLDNPEGLKI